MIQLLIVLWGTIILLTITLVIEFQTRYYLIKLQKAVLNAEKTIGVLLQLQEKE